MGTTTVVRVGASMEEVEGKTVGEVLSNYYEGNFKDNEEYMIFLNGKEVGNDVEVTGSKDLILIASRIGSIKY